MLKYIKKYIVISVALLALICPILFMVSKVSASETANGGGAGGTEPCDPMETRATNCGYGGWRFYVFDDSWEDDDVNEEGFIQISEATGVVKLGDRKYAFLGATDNKPVASQVIDCNGISPKPTGIYRYSILINEIPEKNNITHYRGDTHKDPAGNTIYTQRETSIEWKKGDQFGVQKPCMNDKLGGCDFNGYYNNSAVPDGYGDVLDWDEVKNNYNYFKTDGNPNWDADLEVGLFCGSRPGDDNNKPKKYIACEAETVTLDNGKERDYKAITDLKNWESKVEKYYQKNIDSNGTKGKKFLQNSDGGDGEMHRFFSTNLDELCPTGEDDSPPPEPPTNDTCPNSNLLRGNHIGETGGRSGIAKANNQSGIMTASIDSNGNLLNGKYTDATLTAEDGSVDVYARPDQYLRFNHQYCYGPQGVTNKDRNQHIEITSKNKDNSNNATFSVGLINSGVKNISTPSSTVFGTDHLNIITQRSYADVKTKTTPADAKVKQSYVGSYIQHKMIFDNLEGWTDYWTPEVEEPDCPDCSETPSDPGPNPSKNVESTYKKTTWDVELGQFTIDKAKEYQDAGYYPGSVGSGPAGTWTKSVKRSCKWVGTGEDRYRTCDCKYKCDTNPNYKLGSFRYPFKSNYGYEGYHEYRNITKTATAIIPYNFDTKVKAQIGGGDDTQTVNAGESISLSYSVDTLKRLNPDVDSEAYLTKTPNNTKVQMVYFIIPSDAAITEPAYAVSNADKLTGTSNTGISSGDVCSYYESKNLAYRSSTNSINCKSITTNNESDDHRAVISGSITADTHNVSRIYSNAPVPDMPGAKFCVAAGIYPADSHNRPTNNPDASEGKELESGVNALNRNDNGQEGKVAHGWRISGAVCATIAKKANTQVWGSIYTNGGVEALISRKTAVTDSEESNSLIRTGTYGSWADTTIIAQKGVKLMASAAAIGYSDTLKYPGGNGGSSSFGYCSDMPGNSWNPRLSLTLLTVGRLSSSGSDNCNNDSVIAADGIRVSDKTTSYRELLHDRFTDDNDIKTDNLTIDSWDAAKNAAHPLRKYTYVDSDGTTKTVKTIVINAQNTVTLKNIEVPKNYTLVVNAANIKIKGNICYGDGDCVNARPESDTILKNRNSENFSSISALPQVLLFARKNNNGNPDNEGGNIEIYKDVRQVDAWLIGDGKLDTCQWDERQTELVFDSDHVEHQVSNEKAETCAALLMINGPVLMNDVNLRRSGGAFSNILSEGGVKDQVHSGIEHNLNYDGSVTPAEILNLRPDVYFWSYYQAQQNTQAVSSYTRELAPRL